MKAPSTTFRRSRRPRNLESLRASINQVSDLAPLSKLKKLDRLDLGRTQVKDIAPLAELTALTELQLDGTQVEDFKPLAKLTLLETLSVKGSKVKDLSPLDGLKKLKSVDGRDTPADEDPMNFRQAARPRRQNRQSVRKRRALRYALLVSPSTNRVYAQSASSLAMAELRVVSAEVLTARSPTSAAVVRLGRLRHFRRAARSTNSSQSWVSNLAATFALFSLDEAGRLTPLDLALGPARFGPDLNPKIRRQDQRSLHQAVAQRHARRQRLSSRKQRRPCRCSIRCAAAVRP